MSSSKICKQKALVIYYCRSHIGCLCTSSQTSVGFTVCILFLIKCGLRENSLKRISRDITLKPLKSGLFGILLHSHMAVLF